jgi:hypothetical protein
VLWSIVTVGAIGILLGLRFRAPALLAATAVTAITSALLLEGYGVLSILLLVITLQAAYLVGLSCALAWRRMTVDK